MAGKLQAKQLHKTAETLDGPRCLFKKKKKSSRLGVIFLLLFLYSDLRVGLLLKSRTPARKQI